MYRNMLKKLLKKSIRFIVYVVIFVILLLNLNFANIFSNNSIEIEVSPRKRGYDYGEEISIDVKVNNKNRYGKLYFKVSDVYTGGGFSVSNPSNKEKVVDAFGSSSIEVRLLDKYYSETKDRGKGKHAYGMTDKEYKEFIKYRTERVVGEKDAITPIEYESREETIEKVKSKAKVIVAIFIIILVTVVVLIAFVWFIVKSKNGGFNSKSIIIIFGISLLLNMINKTNEVYASNIYEENIKYDKIVTTQVSYANFTCTVDVKVEYYFVNSVSPITDLSLDTDNDTLPDYLEVLYLTDINNEDTDGDGLSDGVEVFRTNTDPLRVDTDNDGVRDSDEDFDNDGLTNLEEKGYGTDYENPDTDFDGLSDYDEIRGVKTKDNLSTYITDPLSDDTDGDGLRDDIELKLNLNPLDSSDNNTKISQTITQSVLPKELTIESSTPISFMGELVGDIDENVKVKISSNKYYDNLESTVGNTIVVDTTYGNNDGLKIAFDLSKYSNIKDRIQVCKLINGKLQAVDKTYLSGNTLISDCSSGEYVLIDSMKILQDLNVFLN